jgi:uncharacterized membrane protein
MISDHMHPRTALWARAFLLGLVAGLRSQVPFVVLTIAARRGVFAAQADKPLSLLRSPLALASCGAFAVGELIGDKLPTTPSRLAPLPLGGRLVIGGIGGAALAAEARAPLLAGLASGLLGALSGAVAGYKARSFLARVTAIADPVLGAAEDVIAWSLGAALFRTLRKP